MGTEKEPEDDAGKLADRDALKSRIGESRAAAREVVKDSALLATQAGVLRDRAVRTRAQAQSLRERRASDAPLASTSSLITVSAASRLCGVCERTLRNVLHEPGVRARVLFRNRRVGIFCRYTLLLPADLVQDLAARFAAKRERRPPFGKLSV